MLQHAKTGILAVRRFIARKPPAWAFAAAVALSYLLHSGGVSAQGPMNYMHPPQPCPSSSRDQTLFEARMGYLWGFNEIQFRDGNNSLIPPGKKVIELNSPTFGLMAGTAGKDIALRAQAWINIPVEWRNSFLLPGDTLQPEYRSWDTRASYFEADVSAIYQFGLAGIPYTAGLTAGYRYDQFDYASNRVAGPGTFDDHLHMHVPYFGVYYAHDNLLGSVVRLDLLAAPLAFAKVDGKESLSSSSMRVDGNSVSGRMFELLLELSRRVGDRVLLGAFIKGNYLELDGGATLTRTPPPTPSTVQTAFSMDSRHYIAVVGLSGAYSF